MSKRLDILGARIFGASVCHARKSPRLSRKCPNVWTKSYNLAIMHKHKPYIPSTYACICAFCYFVDFLHTFLDIFSKGSGGFGAGFASGGLAGVVSRKVTNSAIKTATTTPGSKPSGLGSLLGDAAAGGIGGHMYASSVSKGGNFANNVIGSVATGSISQMGSISGEKAAEALHSYMGYAALESGAENVPTFQNVEIGGGRITGTEVTAEHPEGISFGMYHADQYVAPEGQYTTVHAVDGTAWYKQYAVDAVDKSPYMAPDGSITFNESIVKKLPPAPRRKDKI